MDAILDSLQGLMDDQGILGILLFPVYAFLLFFTPLTLLFY